jgi:hypothetical protein
MAADDAVDAVLARLGDDGVGVVADELDGVLDAALEIGRERPVGIAEAAPDEIE